MRLEGDVYRRLWESIKGFDQSESMDSDTSSKATVRSQAAPSASVFEVAWLRLSRPAHFWAWTSLNLGPSKQRVTSHVPSIREEFQTFQHLDKWYHRRNPPQRQTQDRGCTDPPTTTPTLLSHLKKKKKRLRICSDWFLTKSFTNFKQFLRILYSCSQYTVVNYYLNTSLCHL